MILHRLEVLNFGPFRETVRVELTPGTKEGRPIILIGALNGSGKTSLLDALLLVLYGKRARCSKRSSAAYTTFLEGCLHKGMAEEEAMRICLDFELPTREGVSRIVVVREWRLEGETIREALAVRRDGEPDAALTEFWDERIEEILPLGLSNLFFFDGEQIRTRTMGEAHSKELEQAIRTMLGLELPGRLRDDLAVIVHREKKELAEARVLESLGPLEDELDLLRSEQHSLEEQLRALKEAEGEAERSLSEAKERFRLGGGDFAVQRKGLEEERVCLSSELAVTETKLRELASGALPLAMVEGILERALARARSEARLSDELRLSGLLSSRDAQLIDELGEMVPDQAVLQRVEAMLAANRKTRLADVDVDVVLGVARRDYDVLAAASAELEAARATTGQLVEERQRTSLEIDRVDRRLQASAAPEDLVELVAAVERASAELGRLRSTLAARQRDLASVNHKLEELRRELDRLLNKAVRARDANREARRVIDSASRVKSILLDYEQRLKRRRLGELERLTTERFQLLIRKEGWIERIEVDEATFQLHLIDGDGEPVPKDQLSAGEKQLLSVAFLWALAEASRRPLPVVIDTPLGRMDRSHRRALVQRYFPNVSHQTVLLSTDSEINEELHALLREEGVVERELRLEYDEVERVSQVREGYFFGVPAKVSP